MSAETMESTATDLPDPKREREKELVQLRDAAKAMGVAKLKDGTWFRKVVAKHVKAHEARINAAYWDKVYPGKDAEERAHRQILSIARRASAAGAMASVGASTGEILSLVTDGLGAPIGVPAAVISMILEAAFTAVLQINLACDLASIYGVPFDADDVGEVATLFGLALEVDINSPKKEEEPDDPEAPHDMMDKLMSLEEGEIASRIGKKLIEEAVMRNIIPVLNIAISARWNFVATRKLGATVKKYVRSRRALQHSCGKLKLDSVTDPSMFVEGAWLLATIDGECGHEELLALALIMDGLPAARRREIELDKTLGDDEEEWFEKLAKLPAEMHDPLLDTLYMIAATDRELEMGERRFLRRVGHTLKREIEFDRVEAICKHLTEGEDLPDDFLRANHAKTS